MDKNKKKKELLKIMQEKLSDLQYKVAWNDALLMAHEMASAEGFKPVDLLHLMMIDNND